ncbi:MAG: ectoine utilization protein EutA [Rubrimonas sp.]|uniref:aspartate racemase/maleate isomerase family protein n=1 Tax=Rubrimonas sp. TaxID=2036015 RepID=UPI002FDCE400
MQIRLVDVREFGAGAFDDRPFTRRVGVLALDSDLTMEADLARMAGGGMAIHVARLPYGGPTTPDTLAAMAPRIAQAARLLPPDEPLDAIAYACTSASAVIGEAAVARAVAEGRGIAGEPVVTPLTAARAGLRALGARRIALLAPYLPEATRPVLDQLSRDGFEIVAATCLGLADDRRMARLSVGAIAEAALRATPREAEALFISCTALRASFAASAIETRLGRPVVASNQALGWALCRLAGVEPSAEGAGALPRLALPDDAFEAAA